MPATQDFTNFATERPNYFPGQFLLEDDFELQHKYLGDRQTYHNQSLQVSGVLEGLEVTPIQDKKEVEIAVGTAIDSAGNLLVLKQKVNFSSFGELTAGILYLQFTQEKANKQQEEIAESFTRWTENIVVSVAETLPEAAIALCTYETISDDEVQVDSTVCNYSGVYLPNATNQNLSIRSGGTAHPNLAVLNGSLKVTGDAETIGNQTVGKNLNVTGKVAIAHESQDANGDALAIGSTLRLGHNLQYGWIQSHNAKPLSINPLGNNIGIGTAEPTHFFHVKTGDAVGLFESTGTQAYLRLSTQEGLDKRVEVANRPGGRLALWTSGGSDALNITQTGNVGIGTTDPGDSKLQVQGKLTVTETLNLQGSKKIIFSDTDTSNNLKIQLWSGYGLGMNGSTLFYAANGNHSWRDNAGTNERMKLTTAANGGLTVYGSGTSSFAGNLTVDQTFTVSGTFNLNVFSDSASDEWPKFTWLRDTSKNWDEGLIKNGTASRGAFGRIGFGVHLDSTREFGLWSSGWTSLLAVEGGTGNTKISGSLTIGGAAYLGHEAVISNFGTKLASGFYENGGNKQTTGNVPDTSHAWSHLITARHGNLSTNHQLQIAASYKNNDRLFFRKIEATNTSNPSWNEVATRDANTFTGQQTFQNTINGVPEGYIKAQFALSGGGIVSWEGIDGRLKWTNRFIAISMQRSTFFPTGHINIHQPTSSIPAANVYDGKARSADANGVVLHSWEALYAVHTVKGNESAVSFQIRKYTNNTNPPSNWILVAVVNHDDGSIKLGSGQIIQKAQRNDFVIAGFVDSSGKIVGGSGFTASRRSTGLYDITFTRPFSTRPAVVATQHFGSDTGNTKDNAVVTVINKGNCRVKTGNGGGDASDRYFCFFAMGAV